MGAINNESESMAADRKKSMRVCMYFIAKAREGIKVLCLETRADHSTIMAVRYALMGCIDFIDAYLHKSGSPPVG